ncbi:hypothetical protein IAQ61_006816 [Plenodomus lingam]|uniref:uncharacterized protein n=1 Tax=Leptosphaeria maculans TaxID=5022 RepID=UPI0033225C39|nr:hypothetical protein IAQ61_006816 [Plenodomus lingam]
MFRRVVDIESLPCIKSMQISISVLAVLENQIPFYISKHKQEPTHETNTLTNKHGDDITTHIPFHTTTTRYPTHPRLANDSIASIPLNASYSPVRLDRDPNAAAKLEITRDCGESLVAGVWGD